MSIESIGLRNVLQLILADERQRTALLRANITAAIRRERNGPGEGGDFFTPFWADAKRHASGELDLREASANRIKSHKGRARLYPELTDGFLTWWEERRRRRNEPFTVTEAQIRGRLTLEGLGTIKVENNLGFAIGEDGYRVIYPYFCEKPQMNAVTAGLGLWVMSQALPSYSLDDMRVLDVLRSTSFSTAEAPLSGGEEAAFRSEYRALLERWRELRRQY